MGFQVERCKPPFEGCFVVLLPSGGFELSVLLDKATYCTCEQANCEHVQAARHKAEEDAHYDLLAAQEEEYRLCMAGEFGWTW